MKAFGDNYLWKALGILIYGIWIVGILAFVWATVPFLAPPAWLIDMARQLFYRNYVF